MKIKIRFSLVWQIRRLQRLKPQKKCESTKENITQSESKILPFGTFAFCLGIVRTGQAVYI